MQEYWYNVSTANKGLYEQLAPLVQASATVLSLIVAGVALYVTNRTAKRQAADNLSAKRQIWIEDLQKDAATFLAFLARREELRRPDPQSTEAEQKQTFDEQRDVDLKANECGIRIKLRLNPTDKDHQELERLFATLAKACPLPPVDETPEQMKVAQAKFSKNRDAIVSQFQKIFAQEWERIKTGALIDHKNN